MATRQGRVYICRPCGTRHESPMNTKCMRPQEPPGQQTPDADPPPQDARAQPKPGRPKRGRAKSSPTYDPTEGPSKRQRGSAETDDTDNDVDPAFQAIMRHLDDIAIEGRDPRKLLANESRREREQIRAFIASMSSTTGPQNILSDEEDPEAEANPSPVRDVPSTV